MRPIWYYDFLSPFAWLQLRKLRRDHADFGFEPRPLLLAAVLKHWGTVGPAEIANKRQFTYRFVLWQARRWQLPLVFPPTHPFNPLPSLRLAIAAGGSLPVVEKIFAHVWAHGRAADTPAALAGLASEFGIDDIDAALAAPEVKSALVQHTQDAIAAGVFGVPSFVIDRRVFWGMDATDMVFDYLADPAGFEDAPMRALEQLPVGIERVRGGDRG